MNYIQAIYYTIVSFSTIGYGDIYPALWVFYYHKNQVNTLIYNTGPNNQHYGDE